MGIFDKSWRPAFDPRSSSDMFILAEDVALRVARANKWAPSNQSPAMCHIDGLSLSIVYEWTSEAGIMATFVTVRWPGKSEPATVDMMTYAAAPLLTNPFNLRPYRNVGSADAATTERG